MVSVPRTQRNRFTEEPQVRIGRSQFDRSHGHKTTFDASYLYPILVDEVLPGDTFTCKLNGFARVFSPLEAPIMDNIELETFFFFVPCRLVWDSWAWFMGEHDEKGIQDTDYTIPILDGAAAIQHDNLKDYHGLAAHMGIPDGVIPDDTDINALPFRCYNLVYNEWFRDQSLIDEILHHTLDADMSIAWYPLQKSAKKHDYFTSALPYLQKGDVSTVLGTLTTLDVETTGTTGEKPSVESTVVGTTSLDAGAAQVDLSGVDEGFPLYVDVSGIGQISINTLRESVAIQRLLERDARGGTRYTEIIKSHFGVTSPDFRLQRPEYLGGGKSFINVSAVANTSKTATEDQGELRGVATGIITGHGWAKSFTEHGYVMGLIRARGDVTYFQGLEKMWTRSTRYDFYIPALANLGEQSILNKELFVQNAAADDNTFGYQERWAEYRYKPSRVTGAFNSDSALNIDFWHLAEDFGGLPTLAATFIEDQTPMSRVTVVDTQPDFILDVWFDYKCARPIPVHSIPSLMGRNF